MKPNFTKLLLILLTLFSFAQAQGLPSETPALTQNTPILAGYDKNFFLQSPDQKFRLNITGYIQSMFIGTFVDNAPDTDTFRMRRARLKFAGFAGDPKLQFTLEYDFAFQRLLTTTLEYHATDAFKIRSGNYKVPYELESIVSASNLQFIERSAITTYIGMLDQRDLGFGLFGKLFNKKVEYDIGVFNGEGSNTTNKNNELRYAGRVNWHVLGQFDNTFTNLSRQTALMLSYNTMYNDDSLKDKDPETKQWANMVDITFKHKRFSSHGLYMIQRNHTDGSPAVVDNGFMAQMGVLVFPKVEMVGRMAYLFKEGSKDIHEYTTGTNVFFSEKLRLQLNYTLTQTKDGLATGDDKLDHTVLAQLQVRI